jgi:hypothetical protein
MTIKKRPLVIDFFDIESDDPGGPHWLSLPRNLENRKDIREKHRRKWLEQRGEIAEGFKSFSKFKKDK